MKLNQNLQHKFPKMRGVGWSKAVWNFSENSSVLGEVGIPMRSFRAVSGQPCSLSNGYKKPLYSVRTFINNNKINLKKSI